MPYPSREDAGAGPVSEGDVTTTSEGWRVGRLRPAAALVLGALLAHSSVASADQITVLCSNGFKAVLQDLAPQFEKATTHQVAIEYSVSAELRRRIDRASLLTWRFSRRR